MPVSCLICSNQLKNKNSLRTHISKYHPKRKTFDVTVQCGKEKELVANENVNHLKCQTDTNEFVQQQWDVLNKDLQDIEEGSSKQAYSSICPSMMASVKVSSMSNDDSVQKNVKRNSRKRKHIDIHKKLTLKNPVPPPRFQQKVKQSLLWDNFYENSDALDYCTSIKSDLQNYKSRSFQPLSPLTSFGIRHLLFKKIEDDRAHLLTKLTGNQIIFVDAVLSLKRLDEVCRLLNGNLDRLLEIIDVMINGDVFS